MKHEYLGQTGKHQLTSQLVDDLGETDLHGLSADFYERRRKMWVGLNRADWWIAVGVYLILSSVAFAVL